MFQNDIDDLRRKAIIAGAAILGFIYLALIHLKPNDPAPGVTVCGLIGWIILLTAYLAKSSGASS